MGADGEQIQHSINTLEKPCIDLVIELNQRDDERPIEVVLSRSILLSTFPFAFVTEPYFEMLGVSIPSIEMKLVILRR